MAEQKNISVVVLTYKRLEALKQCIDALEKNSSLVQEIIVVDNGSGEEVRQWLISNMNRIDPIMRTDNRYGVIARNFGFAEAIGEYIAQVDDDTIVHPNWDVTMIKYFDYSFSDEEKKKGFKIGAVGTQGFRLKTPDWLEKWPAQEWAKPGELCDILTGFCWMFQREEKGIPWEYDLKFVPFWMEETDLQLRMRAAANYKFRATPMVCSHASMRIEPVNWQLHDRNLKYIRDKWKDKLELLNLEGEKS